MHYMARQWCTAEQCYTTCLVRTVICCRICVLFEQQHQERNLRWMYRNGLLVCQRLLFSEQVDTNIVVFSLHKSCPLAAKDFIIALQQRSVYVIPFR